VADALENQSLWSTLREAVRGSQQDLTSIPIRRAVLLLAVPMVLEMSMESLFTVVDIFYVSKLGSDAVAAVGLTESMMSVVYVLSMGLGAAATAVVARRTGEKDMEGAATAAAQVIVISLASACALGVAGAILAVPLLSAMGADEGVISVGAPYTAIMFGGSVTIFLLFVINAIFRSVGAPVVAMRALWLANGLNIVLAPFLVFGIGPFPKLGVTGAAIATTVSRAVGVAYQVLVLSRRTSRIELSRSHFRPRSRLLAELVRLATPASLQILIETASWLGLVRIISGYGSAALAAYTIAMRVAIFALMPSYGLAGAAATLVGQNLGAKEPERARRSVVTIGLYNTVFLTAIGASFVLAPGRIVGLFTTDVDVIALATDGLRIVALGFVVVAYGMVTLQAFNGAGDTTTPMLINLGCFWLFKIPIAWLLAHPVGLGPRGVFVAISLAYSAQSIVSWLVFRRGRWQTRQV